MRRLLAALLVVAAAGCGGDDEPAAGPAPTSTPTATATETATPTPTATATPTPTATPQSPEDQPGGAGDEEAARVPVELTVGPDGITPPEISVPAFLALEVIVHNERPEQVLVRLEGAEPMTIGPGATFRANLEGRRPGRYPIDAGEAGQAVLVTGVEPGP